MSSICIFTERLRRQETSADVSNTAVLPSSSKEEECKPFVHPTPSSNRKRNRNAASNRNRYRNRSSTNHRSRCGRNQRRTSPVNTVENEPRRNPDRWNIGWNFIGIRFYSNPCWPLLLLYTFYLWPMPFFLN